MKKSVLDLLNQKDLLTSRSFPENRLPDSYDEFQKYLYLLLGHVASSDAVEGILTNGILPQIAGVKEVEGSLPTDPRCVYLSANLHISYYLSRIKENTGYAGIVIIVKVDRQKLEADENVFSVMERGNIDIKSQFGLWQSLNFGLCKHRGIVKKECIQSIYDELGSCIWNKASEGNILGSPI